MNFGIQLGIRAWLLLLTQIVAIPLATFSFLSLYKFWEMQEQLIVSTLLQRRADEAMYDAKRLGKNRYVVHARSTRHCGAGRRPLATVTDYRL